MESLQKHEYPPTGWPVKIFLMRGDRERLKRQKRCTLESMPLICSSRLQGETFVYHALVQFEKVFPKFCRTRHSG